MRCISELAKNKTFFSTGLPEEKKYRRKYSQIWISNKQQIISYYDYDQAHLWLKNPYVYLTLKCNGASCIFLAKSNKLFTGWGLTEGQESRDANTTHDVFAMKVLDEYSWHPAPGFVFSQAGDPLDTSETTKATCLLCNRVKPSPCLTVCMYKHYQ